MFKKRYQYISKNGIVWTEWFTPISTIKEKWQLNGKLLNEYNEGVS